MFKKLKTFLFVFKNSLVNLDYYREVLKVKFSFSLKYFVVLLYISSLMSTIPVANHFIKMQPILKANQTYYFDKSQEVWLTKDRFFTADQSIPFDITPVLDNLSTTIPILIIFGPMFLLPIIFVEKTIYLSIFSLFFRNSQIKFKKIFQLAMHASTLPIIFFALLSVFGLYPTIPFGYTLVLGIFFVAIWKNLSS